MGCSCPRSEAASHGRGRASAGSSRCRCRAGRRPSARAHQARRCRRDPPMAPAQCTACPARPACWHRGRDAAARAGCRDRRLGRNPAASARSARPAWRHPGSTGNCRRHSSMRHQRAVGAQSGCGLAGGGVPSVAQRSIASRLARKNIDVDTTLEKFCAMPRDGVFGCGSAKCCELDQQ